MPATYRPEGENRPSVQAGGARQSTAPVTASTTTESWAFRARPLTRDPASETPLGTRSGSGVRRLPGKATTTREVNRSCDAETEETMLPSSTSPTGVNVAPLGVPLDVYPWTNRPAAREGWHSWDSQ